MTVSEITILREKLEVTKRRIEQYKLVKQEAERNMSRYGLSNPNKALTRIKINKKKIKNNQLKISDLLDKAEDHIRENELDS